MNKLNNQVERNEPMKPENKAEVKTPQEFYTEKAVYHVDGYEYNVDEPELVKAFHLFAEQQIGVYKSDLVKKIEDERQMRPYTDDLQSAYDSGWNQCLEHIVSIITKEQ